MQLKTWIRSIATLLFLLALPALTMAEVSVNVSVGFPPPELPVYEQPPIPDDGYLWTPGYWAWSGEVQDYYWVPGTWVLAPQPEYLWTPGYWGEEAAVFFWHPGYWGPHVGFYGGVNYGYGYGGEGFEGGYWRGGRLYYNRSVNNINNTNITNVYNQTVINNVSDNRVSYNGGDRGVRFKPSEADATAARDRHIAVTPVQRQHEQVARNNPVLRASENNGRPPIAATPRPGAFSAAGVVPASQGGPLRGTMSVIHANPQPRGSQPEYRAPQPENRVAQPANRPVQSDIRTSQPANRPLQPEYRVAQPPPIRPAPPEYRQAQPEQRAPRPAAPETPRPQQPVFEQRRQSEPPPPPRQAAPQPPAPAPRGDPRAAEHPSAHPGPGERDRR